MGGFPVASDRSAISISIAGIVLALWTREAEAHDPSCKSIAIQKDA